jgi:hypothetical protein
LTKNREIFTAKVAASATQGRTSQGSEQGLIRLDRPVRANNPVQEKQRHERGRGAPYTNSEKGMASDFFYSKNHI